MKKIISYLTILIVCCTNVYAVKKENQPLFNRLDRIERKIDALSDAISKCAPTQMMQKMQPMHEKMMGQRKNDTKKQEATIAVTKEEEHKEHHPEKVNK